MFEKSFLITFNTESYFDKSSLEQHLRTYEKWGIVTENTWIVKTSFNPRQIHDQVKKFLPSNSRLLVIKVQKNAAWSNVLCPSDWINDNLSII
jgi:hypothetical protein